MSVNVRFPPIADISIYSAVRSCASRLADFSLPPAASLGGFFLLLIQRLAGDR